MWYAFPAMPGKERPPESVVGAEEMRGLSNALAETFIQRRDLYAKQLDDGSYVSIRKPLRRPHLVRHLQGELTLGAYVLDENSHGRYLVLDADNDPDWRRLQALASALAEQGDIAYLEGSRRGGHLWLFFVEPLPGGEVRRFGQGLLSHFGIEDIELFPKQDAITSGPGSLIRLPFGLHQKSGRRYGFYLPDGKPLAGSIREQIRALSAPETISRDIYEQFAAYVPQKAPRTPYRALSAARGGFEESGDPLPASEQIKEAITVRQFVLRYMELSKTGKGLCPFHDDRVESFHVNDERNFWYCFACEKGGSVIDFYMELEGCEANAAISELSEMLLR